MNKWQEVLKSLLLFLLHVESVFGHVLVESVFRHVLVESVFRYVLLKAFSGMRLRKKEKYSIIFEDDNFRKDV